MYLSQNEAGFDTKIKWIDEEYMSPEHVLKNNYIDTLLIKGPLDNCQLEFVDLPFIKNIVLISRSHDNNGFDCEHTLLIEKIKKDFVLKTNIAFEEIHKRKHGFFLMFERN